MDKIPIIAVPTQEISEIVQKKLFELGYIWLNENNIIRISPVSKYGISAYIGLRFDKSLCYAHRDFYINRGHEYKEITMWDLYQMEPDPKVFINIEYKNGRIINKPLNLKIAKSLGLIE